MLAKAASNMTTIWHDSHSYTSNCNATLYIPDQDTYNDVNSGAPDFSEFKDPWENYSVHTDPFMTDVSQQIDECKQYYCDTNSNDTEETHFVLHNKSRAETPPSAPPTNQNYEQQQEHNTSRSHDTFQASQQEIFSFECEVYRESEQENSVGENINEATAHCNFTEHTPHESEDHNHRTNHQNNSVNHHDDSSQHIDIHNNNHDHTHYDNDNHTNGISHNEMKHQSILESSTSAGSNVYDCMQSSSGIIDYDQTQTDSQPPSSSHTPEPCTDPHNVAMQSELSDRYIENADVSSFFYCFLTPIFIILCK